MRISYFLALTMASVGLHADVLTQEFTIDTYSLNHQGTEFNYIDNNEFTGPMKFELNYDLNFVNGVFYSNVDMDDENFRYVSSNTQFDASSLSYSYESILIDEIMSYQSKNAFESSRLHFTDILFDSKPDGRFDMIENGSNLHVSVTTVTESIITGDRNNGNFTETQKLYSTYFNFSAHEYFDLLDAEDPTASTLTDFTDFLAENPVTASFGIEGYTQYVEYQNYQLINESIFNYSGLWGSGEAVLTNQERKSSAVTVSAPATLALFGISIFALGYRCFQFGSGNQIKSS